MTLFAVSVFDSAVGAYSPPIFAKSKGEAIRSFSDACNDSSTAMSKHPQDYILFELGSFDELTGQFHTLDAPKSLGVAIEFVSSE